MIKNYTTDVYREVNFNHQEYNINCKHDKNQYIKQTLFLKQGISEKQRRISNGNTLSLTPLMPGSKEVACNYSAQLKHQKNENSNHTRTQTYFLVFLLLIFSASKQRRKPHHYSQKLIEKEDKANCGTLGSLSDHVID